MCVYIGLEHGEQEAETLRRQALKSPHIDTVVGLLWPYIRSLLTLVWSKQAPDWKQRDTAGRGGGKDGARLSLTLSLSLSPCVCTCVCVCVCVCVFARACVHSQKYFL